MHYNFSSNGDDYVTRAVRSKKKEVPVKKPFNWKLYKGYILLGLAVLIPVCLFIFK